jgi:hypothetical protein
MIIEQAIKEWTTKSRHMGCVAATNWFIKRVKGFYPKRCSYFTKNGEIFEHVVATNGVVTIDLAPYANKPRD